jgi:hypothetical protein
MSGIPPVTHSPAVTPLVTPPQAPVGADRDGDNDHGREVRSSTPPGVGTKVDTKV